MGYNYHLNVSVEIPKSEYDELKHDNALQEAELEACVGKNDD